MEKLNAEFIQNLQNKLDKQNHHCCDFRENKDCNKAVFVRRVFKMLCNKRELIKHSYLVYMPKTKRGYGNNYEKYTEHYVMLSVSFFRFALSHSNSEYKIVFVNERMQFQSITVHYNDLLNLTYEIVIN